MGMVVPDNRSVNCTGMFCQITLIFFSFCLFCSVFLVFPFFQLSDAHHPSLSSGYYPGYSPSPSSADDAVKQRSQSPGGVTNRDQSLNLSQHPYHRLDPNLKNAGFTYRP